MKNRTTGTGRRAAEKRDELATLHSITSSARASIIAATRTAVRHRTTFDIERAITFKSPGSTPPG
jgi:hypothetical protein